MYIVLFQKYKIRNPLQFVLILTGEWENTDHFKKTTFVFIPNLLYQLELEQEVAPSFWYRPDVTRYKISLIYELTTEYFKGEWMDEWVHNGTPDLQSRQLETKV